LPREILRPLQEAASLTRRSGSSFAPRGTRKPPFIAPATQETDTAMLPATRPAPGSWIWTPQLLQIPQAVRN